MARLAIIGLLSLALFVLEVSSQSGNGPTEEPYISSGYGSTEEPYISSGSGSTEEPYISSGNGSTEKPYDDEPTCTRSEPNVPIDTTWKDEICQRYPDGAIVNITMC